jgi:hypothetical protein
LGNSDFSVTAFMCVFNEADILPWTLKHLIEQGMDVHVIDNWSTDGSDRTANRFPLVGFEQFPAEGDGGTYRWRHLLQRVEVLVPTYVLGSVIFRIISRWSWSKRWYRSSTIIWSLCGGPYWSSQVASLKLFELTTNVSPSQWPTAYPYQREFDTFCAGPSICTERSASARAESLNGNGSTL